VIRFLCPLALAVSIAILTGCGSSGGPSSTPASAGTVKFVGNSTCPTEGQQPYSPSPPQVNSLPAVGQAIDEMPHNHVAEGAQVQYNHDPPTSGCHYNLGYGAAPIQAGAYDRPVQAGYWVHNLEHGYVVVLYNCPSGCASEFQQLRTWFKGLPPDPTGAVPYTKVVILPWPSMTVPFAAVSWDWFDPIPIFSIDEVQRFYANHVGHGPEVRGP
jgi:uncharacterized protein DUF3105